MNSRFYYDGHHQAVATGIRDHLNSVSGDGSEVGQLEWKAAPAMLLRLYVWPWYGRRTNLEVRDGAATKSHSQRP